MKSYKGAETAPDRETQEGKGDVYYREASIVPHTRAITRIAPTGKQMKFNPDILHRRSIRLKGFDYSRAGAYFVTACVQHRECLFGSILNGEVVLNDAGRMVKAMWEALPERFQVVQLDKFMVMPNHFHGIIMLNPLHDPDSINNRRGESCIRPVFRIRPDVGDGMGEKGDHKDRPYCGQFVGAGNSGIQIADDAYLRTWRK